MWRVFVVMFRATALVIVFLHQNYSIKVYRGKFWEKLMQKKGKGAEKVDVDNMVGLSAHWINKLSSLQNFKLFHHHRHRGSTFGMRKIWLSEPGAWINCNDIGNLKSYLGFLIHIWECCSINLRIHSETFSFRGKDFCWKNVGTNCGQYGLAEMAAA